MIDFKIGAHVSIKGGLHLAVERAAAIGCNCMQVFSGNPRSWQRSMLADEIVKKMFAKQQELKVASIFIHASYLINLASDKQELVAKSVRSLIFDLRVNSLVKGSGVIVHLGSHQGRGWAAAKTQVKEAINEILAQTPQDSVLLIENSAGQKGKIASDLKEIKWFLDQLQSSRIGWCVDTSHSFAAGYPLVKSSVFNQKSNNQDLISTITALKLDTALKCIHVNDSKTAFNSGRDRHENIGDGLIPRQDLRGFLRNNLFRHMPMIAEVPGLDGTGPDKENIKRLKEIVS